MLELQNVCCGYAEEFFLRNINLTIKGEKIIGIIGPNGSGKTTLLRAITKVLPLRSGAIFFNAQGISLMTYRELAKQIAVVSNDIESYFDITVEDFVALGRIPHQRPLQFFENAQDAAVINQALEMTDMLCFRKRGLKQLSAGERQLVIIAKALAQQPKLLLLDEPIVHLDISHQAYILDLLKRLHEENNLSVIIVLHELNLASEYCDQLVLMDKGRVYKTGTPQQVLRQEIIKKVYKTDIVIRENPLSGKPHIFVVAGRKEAKE